jgi:hypothetical protein
MIYGDNFNLIFDAISRIEKHIGLNTSNDDLTVNGRLNQIMTSPAFRSSGAIEPFCETDIEIVGDNFTIINEPMMIGQSWVVQNTATIMVNRDSSFKYIEEWFDIEFDGTTGTLVGADGRFDGDFITVTYFHNNLSVYYDIVFTNGFPEVVRSSEEVLNLVVKDTQTEDHYRITIDSKGRISNLPTLDEVVGENAFIDSNDSDIYEIFVEDGYMNWRII